MVDGSTDGSTDGLVRAASTSRLLARRAPIHADVSAAGRVLLTTTHVAEGSDDVAVTLTVMDLTTGVERPIAAAQPGDHSAVWAPDGRGLAWCTNRDGVDVLWRAADVDAGEASADDGMVPDSVGASGPPAWSPDGRQLAFTAPRRAPIDRTRPFRWSRGLLHFDGYGPLDTPPQVRVVDLETGESRWLTDDDQRWSSLRWSPDGLRLAACAGLDPDGRRGGHDLFVLGLDGSVVRPAVSPGRAVVPVWLDADRLLVLVVDPHDRPAGSDAALFLVDGDGEVVEELAAAGLGGDVYGDQPAELLDVYDNVLLVAPDGSVITRTVERGRLGIVRWRFDAPSRALVDPVVLAGGDRTNTPVGVSGDRLLFVTASPVATGELATVGLDGTDERTVSAFAPGPASGVQVRRFSVETDAPAPVDAWLLVPDGAGESPPAVLIVHGGPNFAYGETFSIDAHALCAAGFAVLYANPRGSTGAGVEFVQAGIGDWAAGPTRDVLAVVDHAVASGWIDGERLGVTGNSYGGYLAAWLASTTSRFRAAVAENPVTDLVGMATTSDIGSWFFAAQFGPLPERLETYVEQSPLFRASECATPILFVVGELDRRCPPAQAWAMHRLMRQHGRVSEVLVLPDSTHEGSTYGPPPARRAHDAALVEWMQRWL